MMEMKRYIVFTVIAQDEISMKHFEVLKVNDGLIQSGDLEAKEIGPSMSLTLRRAKLADADQWKHAVK